MTVRNLSHLLAPRSVVLIGASTRPGSLGAILARNLVRGGFAGRIDLVNPKGGSIEGHACLASVAALPEVPDLAVIATPPDTLPGLIADLGAKGCRAAVVITAGVRGALRQAMLEAARPHLLRIQGPNCLGLQLPALGLDASFSHIAPRPGRLAFLSQSGALITGVVDWAQARRIGFSHVVSLGDMADVDFGDLLDYLAADTASSAILLYMESLSAAPKFMSAARRAARAKPVVIIKAGRQAAGARAAASHTGALAGSDAAYAAAFQRAGLVRVEELDELFEAAEILSKAPPLAGERLGILTNGGGAGVLAADRAADLACPLGTLSPATLARLDASLPPTWSRANPIDIIGDADAARYAAAVCAALDDPGFDALLVMNCPTALQPSIEAARVVVDVLAARAAAGQPVKPVLTNWLGAAAAAEARALFAANAIPTFDTPAQAVAGIAQLIHYRRAQTALMATPPSLPDGVLQASEEACRLIAAAVREGPRVLTETEAKAILAAYAIPVVETRTAATPEAAALIAAPMLAAHGAVAVKIWSRDISHKSDIGGVVLGLTSPQAVAAAARDVLARAAAAVPGARLDGLTVEPMVVRPGAHELIVGMSVDATFGPLVMFGAGGVAVERIRDTALGLPPLDLNLARAMMSRTRIWGLLQGYRDRPPADIDAIALVLVRLSYLAARHPEIREIDINPLMADHRGVVALDARIAVSADAADPRVPLVIQPYPSEWERDIALATLGPVQLRPIRPDDERLYDDFFAAVTPADARLRFFAPPPAAAHAFRARLTQIDYAREMAFVAIAPDSGRLMGVARLIADPDRERGEFAVLVRSDLKGQGLGWALMTHLIAFGRATGLGTLYGDVLRENASMLQMAAAQGFTLASVPGDATLVRATLALQAP